MNSTLSIQIAGLKEVETIASLARQIWPSTYQDILTPDQLRYMMDLFYSNESLKKQMLEQKHVFLIIGDDIAPIGFASYSPTKKKSIYKLHKIYVLPGLQGKGLGKFIVDFIIQKIHPEGATALQLNVNRFNKARYFYEKLGFQVIGEEDIDIGNNYFMNDFVMERKI
jgi:GNAT superfamily N-acetyltransferase